MARGRLISRSLGSSRKYHALLGAGGKLGEFCQVLFPLVIANTDDFGRMPGDAFTVKNVVLPSSRRPEKDFESALAAMEHVELLTRYAVDGEIYLQVNHFDEHQPNLQKRGASAFPGPSGDTRLDQTERDIEAVYSAQLESGALTVCDFTVTKVNRQVRIGNCYLDIVAETQEGPALLLELKRQRITNDAVAQIRSYMALLDRPAVPLLIGSGIAATLELKSTQPINVFEYDDTLMLTALTSWDVLQRPITFKHVTPTRARAELNLIEVKRTESKRTQNPEQRTERVRAADTLFAAFWDAYPKKKAKDAAQRAWDKRRPNSELLTVILRALERQKASPDWQKDSGRYIPFPATWLTAGRWTDEVDVDIGIGLSDTARYNIEASDEAERLILGTGVDQGRRHDH